MSGISGFGGLWMGSMCARHQGDVRIRLRFDEMMWTNVIQGNDLVLG